MIDFGKTASDYARYRVPFAPRLIDRLCALGIGTPGQRIMDVGAGTGLLASPFSDRGANVTCIDLRFELLDRPAAFGALPRARIAAAGRRRLRCRRRRRSAGIGSIGGERRGNPARAQARRDRRGHLPDLYPVARQHRRRTEQLILQHRPGWHHANSTGINGQVLRDLQISGFCGIESFSFDVEIEFTREAWRGYIRTTSAVGASMAPEHLKRFDDEHESLLRDGGEPLPIPHRVFVVVARKPV